MVGFVLVARSEPSVLRAAVMGSVALVGMGADGRARGARALGAAVLLLVLADPWLADAPGFALSVLASAGIIWLAPGWRDRLARWTPRWVAEAVSVPLAAQLACTPLVAAVSGQVSLVAVVANLAAAPAVAPATVLGLAGGVVGLGLPAAGRLVAAPAAWCAGWIIAVATHSAALPVAAVGWSARPVALALLTLLCVLAALLAGAVLVRPLTAVAAGLVMVLAVLVRPPTLGWLTPGWPPEGWVMVACDVGQGDGLVLRAGEHRAVVVDTGPDPAPMDACLRRLGVTEIPLLVLTHFHADHVGGLAGALHGRQVGRIEVTDLDDPAPGCATRCATSRTREHVEVRRASYGESGSAGPLRWQEIAPSELPSPDSDSPPNDASIVLLVQTRGVRILLMGDEERTSQEQLWRVTGGALRADVLKVAHHGSARQDPELVRGVHARLGLISVGVDNDYGHPAPSTLALLRDAGIRVGRTDRGGDVAVVVGHGGLRLVSRRSPAGDKVVRVTTYSFSQVDVFGSAPLLGNPVAVVHDAVGLDDETMAAFARWTNLSETTFLLPPTEEGRASGADYRLRIFTPDQELPFAGHPTLGSAHAWRVNGGEPSEPGRLVQECGSGLVEVRQDDDHGAFRAPPFLREGPADEQLVERVLDCLGPPARDHLVSASWIDNGPGWLGLHLDSAEARPRAGAEVRRPGGGHRRDRAAHLAGGRESRCRLRGQGVLPGRHR